MATDIAIASLSSLPPSQIADGDIWPIVDISDLTSPGGTTKAALSSGIAQYTNKHNGVVSVTDPTYGAIPDKTTDNLPAFIACYTDALATGRAMYIPPAPPNYYYRISDVFHVSSFANFRLFGAGVRSLIVIDNASGANAITVDASIMAYISNIGISGIIGSGHGIEFINASHRPIVENVWVCWVDGNGFQNTSGISPRYINCTANQNNGYDPAGLGPARGLMKIGINIPYNASGYTNNATCVACDLEGAATYNLKVGDSSGIVETFDFYGGTIQGSGTWQEVYLRTRDGTIRDSHIEPKTGATSNYVVTFDRCTNTCVTGGALQGDVQMIACTHSGTEGIRGSGYDIDASCLGCYVRDGETGNITTGPTGGVLKDRGISTDVYMVTNSGNTRLGSGYRQTSTRATSTTGLDWDGTVPSGYTNVGATVTQVTDGSGNTSIRLQISAGGFTQYLGKFLGPIESLRGKWVTIDAYLTNAVDVTLAKFALIEGVFSGSTTAFVSSNFTTGVQERLQAAFYVGTSETTFQFRLTGTNGADINWHSVNVSIEGFDALTEATLATSATPSLGDNGYQLGQYICPTGTAITAFTTPEIGKPFTLLFTGARTITHSATMVLSGAADFVGKTGDTLTLSYSSNATFYEVARMVS